MDHNSKIAVVYNNFMVKVEDQLREEFPSVTWRVARFDEIKAMGETDYDYLLGYDKPKATLIIAEMSNGDTKYERRTLLTSEDLHEATMTRGYRTAISEAGAQLHAELMILTS